MSIEWMMPSNHLILCHPLLLLLSIFPGIGVFSSESLFTSGGSQVLSKGDEWTDSDNQLPCLSQEVQALTALLPMTSQECRSVSEMPSSPQGCLLGWSWRYKDTFLLHRLLWKLLSLCLGQILCKMGMWFSFFAPSLGHWEDSVCGEMMWMDFVKPVCKQMCWGVPFLWSSQACVNVPHTESLATSRSLSRLSPPPRMPFLLPLFASSSLSFGLPRWLSGKESSCNAGDAG